jgi:cobalamin biosynthesis protein CobD/CbiB
VMGAVAAGLLAGAVADRVVGDPRRGHPVAAFGCLAAALERRVWRASRTAGAGYVVALIGGTTGAAAWADRRLGRRPLMRALLVAGLTWAALGGPAGVAAYRAANRLDAMVGHRKALYERFGWGGRNRYGDRVEQRPPLGDGPPPDPDDVERAVRLSLLVGAAATAVAVVSTR